jgi:uncharacterized membrane protein YccC
VRRELAPRPGRWRSALIVAGGSTLALSLALFLQFATFPAPLMAFKGLLPSVVHSGSLLALRLVAIAGGAILATNLTGIAVQTPWLLVPGFFVTLALITYLVPIRQNPIAGYCLALTIAGVVYTGVFAPRAIGRTALTMAIGFTIGTLVAAGFAFLRALPPPRERLASALAAHFTALREQLAAAGARFRAAAAPVAPADRVPLSALAAHLQLLGLVRMQHLDAELERAFLALITAAERVALFVELAAHGADRPGARTLRRALDAELGALLAGLDTALARYAAVAATPTAAIELGRRPTEPWPDLAALVAALHAREQALARTPAAVAGVDVDESAAFHAFAQALGGIAEVLHAPPEAHEALPPEPGPPPPRRLLPPFDPYAALFAMKIALATTVALIIGVAVHAPALETVVLNPLILAQGSYGATLRKTWLRLAGVLLGGFLAVLAVIGLMPNTGDPTGWLVVFFAVMVPCAYLSLGGEALSYLGLQIAVTFMIILVADAPVTDPRQALWRFLGTVVGALVLFGVFQVVVPDYAGRQLVSRFADLLRLLLAGHPPLGEPMPATARARALGDQITAGLADVLRLAEEARYEGAASGVDRDAAVQAVGILRRIAHRLALARRARRVARPPLPPAAVAAQHALDAGVRTRLQRLLAMCSARHHRARTDSARHRAARAAARVAAAAPRPDLAAPLAAFVAAADTQRHAADAPWPREPLESLMAEVDHLRRVADLLPQLEEQLERAILP